MDTESTALSGGGEALPAAKTPTSDLAQPTAAPEPKEPAPTEPDAEKAKAEQEREKQRNRTREYINRLNRENAEMRARMAEIERSRTTPEPTPKAPADNGPTLEDFNYDLTAFQQARDNWLADKLKRDWTQEQTRAEQTRRQQETLAAYNDRLASFAESHPDFPEVVGSISVPLPQEVLDAIMAHPQGPELAYHLGNNEDDAFLLASINPHIADAAVQRIAARLSAAPAAAPITPAPALAPTKPISQTPQPPPKVAGRSPTETPPEKMTDEDWLRREREKRRRR